MCIRDRSIVNTIDHNRRLWSIALNVDAAFMVNTKEFPSTVVLCDAESSLHFFVFVFYVAASCNRRIRTLG